MATPTSAQTLIGIELQGPLEQSARRSQIIGHESLVPPSQALKTEVHRIGICRPLRASGLGDKELRVYRVRKARDDFVLHVEEVDQGLIEPFRPNMIAALGIDELDADAHPIAAALYAALQNVTDVQLATDLLQIDGLALVLKAVLRPITKEPPMRDRSVVRLSVTPSTK